MDNPYTAPTLTPELVKEERRRPKVWRSLLLAYAVHHVMSVSGFVAGILLLSADGFVYFPDDLLLTKLFKLAVSPPFIDLYLLLEPFLVGDKVPDTFVALRWLRTGVVIACLVSIVFYGFARRRAVLYGVGIVSFVLSMSLPITYSLDRETFESASISPGPSLVSAVAVASQHQQSQLQPFAAEAIEQVALLGFAGALDDDLEQLGRAARRAIGDWGFGNGDLVAVGIRRGHGKISVQGCTAIAVFVGCESANMRPNGPTCASPGRSPG